MKKDKDHSLLGAILIPLGPALAPVFTVWKTNSAEVLLVEVVRPLLLTLVASVVISGALLGLLRRKKEGTYRVTLLVTAFWLLFWGYSFLRDKSLGLAIFFMPDVLTYADRWGIPFWWAVATVVLVSLSFLKRWLPTITHGMAAMSALLFIMALPWQALRKPAPKPIAPVATPNPRPRDPSDKRPNIYVIVLDGYARTDVLRTLHNCDDSAFIDGLKSRGFQVAARSQANYIQTALALGALFRMDYWPAIQDRNAVEALVELGIDCPLREYMAAHKYRSIAYLSSGPLTEGLLQETRLDLAEAPTRFGALENLLLDTTPLTTAISRGEIREYANHRLRLKNTLHRLGEALPGSDPYLVLGHILLPHPPFVFGPNGEERTPPIPYSIGDATGYRGNGEEYGQAYADQVKWVGPQILKAIDSLRENSSRPPVILLMGDHGSRRYTDWAGAEHTYMPEAFGNLLAVSVPDDLKASFGTLQDNATPLPVFRRVLNTALDEKLPLLPDHSYYSTLQKGFAFIDVAEAARKPVSVEDAKRIHPSKGR